MRTYADLVDYALKNDLPEGYVDEEYIEFIFQQYNLPCEPALITCINVVSRNLDNRAYCVKVMLYDDVPFGVLVWGGRKMSDFCEFYCTDQAVFIQASKYIFELLLVDSVPSNYSETSILPGYSDYYPWEFLPSAKPKGFTELRVQRIDIEKEEDTDFYEIWSNGYSYEEALDMLKEKIEQYSNIVPPDAWGVPVEVDSEQI